MKITTLDNAKDRIVPRNTTQPSRIGHYSILDDYYNTSGIKYVRKPQPPKHKPRPKQHKVIPHKHITASNINRLATIYQHNTPEWFFDFSEWFISNRGTHATPLPKDFLHFIVYQTNNASKQWFYDLDMFFRDYYNGNDSNEKGKDLDVWLSRFDYWFKDGSTPDWWSYFELWYKDNIFNKKSIYNNADGDEKGKEAVIDFIHFLKNKFTNKQPKKEQSLNADGDKKDDDLTNAKTTKAESNGDTIKDNEDDEKDKDKPKRKDKDFVFDLVKYVGVIGGLTVIGYLVVKGLKSE